MKSFSIQDFKDANFNCHQGNLASIFVPLSYTKISFYTKEGFVGNYNSSRRVHNVDLVTKFVF